MRKLLFLFILLSGCSSSSPTPGKPIDLSSKDLSVNPRAVLLFPQDWSEFSLNGIQLGEDWRRIPPAKISSVNEKSGWTILRDANRYRVKKGVIDGLGIWDQKLLQQLDVKTESQIPQKFGKVESSIPISTNVTVYEYQDGHLHIFWNQLEKRLVGVEVTK